MADQPLGVPFGSSYELISPAAASSDRWPQADYGAVAYCFLSVGFPFEPPKCNTSGHPSRRSYALCRRRSRPALVSMCATIIFTLGRVLVTRGSAAAVAAVAAVAVASVGDEARICARTL